MKIIIYFILLLCSLWGFAQNPVKYGKISQEELNKTKSSYGENIAAEIISSKEAFVIAYDLPNKRFMVTKRVSVRAKIYNKNQAPDHLVNIKVPLRLNVNNLDEKLVLLKAVTYNLENGEEIKSKLSKSDVYTEKVHKYLKYKKFAFPNVKDGSVLEYKYEISSPVYWDSKIWYFQSDVPVLYSNFYISYPEFFVYQPDWRGEYAPKIDKDLRRGDRGYDFEKISYQLKNIPPLKDEPFVLNPNNMKSSIRMELVEYNFPGYGYENYAATWERITKDLYNSSSFGKQLKGTGFLDDTVAEIIGNVMSEREKMNLIFNYVKNNYSWNNYRGIGGHNNIKKTFKSKTGNIAEINLLLVAMLQKAGIKAYPVVLSSVKNGMLSYFPSLQKLDYVIASVVSGKTTHLMDATEKYSKIDMLPLRALNFRGFQIMEKGHYRELNLTNRLLSDNKSIVRAKINEQNVEGAFSVTYGNYYAMNKIKDLEENPTQLETDFLKGYDIGLYDLNITKGTKNDAIRFTSKFDSDGFIEEIGGKLILSPLLFLRQKENPLKQEERKFPLEFATPYSELKQVSITLPQGYSVEQLPEMFTYEIPNKVGVFVIKYELKGEILNVYSIERINYSLLPQDYFQAIKELNQKKVEKENQQIILVKKEE